MDTLPNLEPIEFGEYSTKELTGDLDDFPLLIDLGYPEKELLARQMQIYHTEAGTDIFREGDEGFFICFVLDGKIELIKESESGGEKSLGIIGPGKTVGEMTLIDGEHRSATARCVRDTRIAVLTKAGFENLAATHTALALKLMWRLAKLVSQRLRQTTGLLVDHLEG